MFPGLFRYARAVIFDIQATTLLTHVVTDAYPRFGMAHGVAHQVLQGAVQVAQLGFNLRSAAIQRIT